MALHCWSAAGSPCSPYILPESATLPCTAPSGSPPRPVGSADPWSANATRGLRQTPHCRTEPADHGSALPDCRSPGSADPWSASAKRGLRQTPHCRTEPAEHGSALPDYRSPGSADPRSASAKRGLRQTPQSRTDSEKHGSALPVLFPQRGHVGQQPQPATGTRVRPQRIPIAIRQRPRQSRVTARPRSVLQRAEQVIP